MKSGPEKELFKRYLDRSNKSGRQLGFSGPQISEWPESRLDSGPLRKSEEADRLASALKPGGILVCLDERGKDITSEELAALMQGALENSVPQIAFAIGGPDGHSSLFREKARHVIRFGKMTWPHQLARVMLTEQLYRAITILAGHPYHRS